MGATLPLELLVELVDDDVVELEEVVLLLDEVVLLDEVLDDVVLVLDDELDDPLGPSQSSGNWVFGSAVAGGGTQS